jgi:hypothetical protein
MSAVSSPEMEGLVGKCEFPVIYGFEVFLMSIMPFLIDSKVLLGFVKKGNPTKSSSFQNKLVELIKDYSGIFVKIGKKTIQSLKRIPNETELSAIFETIRMVANDDKYYEAFKKNVILVENIIDKLSDPLTLRSKQEIDDNKKAFIMYNDIIAYLRASRFETKFVAKYNTDKSKVMFYEVYKEEYCPILLRKENQIKV